MDGWEANNRPVVIWRKQDRHAIVQIRLETLFNSDGHYYIKAKFIACNNSLIRKNKYHGRLCIVPADNRLLRKLYSAAVKNSFSVVSFPVAEMQDDNRMLIAIPDANNLFMTLHPRTEGDGV